MKNDSGTRRTLIAWVVYDMASHAYALMVAGVAYPVYFASHVAGGRADADLLWAVALGLSLVTAGLLGPWLGAVADAMGRRRKLLIATTLGSAVATALLYFVREGNVVLGIGAFAVAHILHLLAVSLYNSYLPLIAAPGRYARVSAIAWGLSYLGSLSCFIFCLPFVRGGLAPENVSNFMFSFIVTALFLLLIGLPAAFALPEVAPRDTGSGNARPHRRIAGTLREWLADRNVPKLLLAYYLVNDGIVTVAFFTALTFRTTFGLDVQEILLLTLVVQLVAIPSTIAFGWLGERWSQRGAIYVALALWLAVLGMMATVDGLAGAMAITPAIGLVIGSTQSLFRSLFAGLVPAARASEYFGFHLLVGRASAALGPLAFGAVSLLTGSQRAAMASLAIFFIGGGVALAFVRLQGDQSDKPAM